MGDLTGLAFSEALRSKGDDPTCYIRLNNNAKPEVVMTGIWTGKTIKGAIRAIERHYKSIKYSALRLSIKQKQAEQSLKEAKNVPAVS